MDFFTKNKMLFWCVVVLVVLNIATLASFWLRKPPIGPLGRGQTADGKKIMAQKLGLSPEQDEQLQQIRQEHFARTQPLQDDMHMIRMDLLDEIFQTEPDEAKIEELITEIGVLQSEFEENLYNHFRQLKAMCNAEQEEELKLMLRNLLEMTRPRDPQAQQRGMPGRMGPGQGPPPRR